MGVVNVKLTGESITLKVVLPRARELGVVIKPKGADLVFEIWGRFVGERLWHAWPSDHVPEDFLDRLETAIVCSGLEELAQACVGKPSDAELMSRATSAVEEVLVAAYGATRHAMPGEAD